MLLNGHLLEGKNKTRLLMYKVDVSICDGPRDIFMMKNTRKFKHVSVSTGEHRRSLHYCIRITTTNESS